jgi:hypothetical protein
MNETSPQGNMIELTLSDIIPGPEEPWRMSFGELAVALSLCDSGSERAAHLEQELRRRLVAERRQKARYSTALWFLVGALVAITAFQLGPMRTLSARAATAAPSAATAFMPVSALKELYAN